MHDRSYAFSFVHHVNTQEKISLEAAYIDIVTNTYTSYEDLRAL